VLLPAHTQKWGTLYLDSNNPGSFQSGSINSTNNNAIANTVMQIGLYGNKVDTKKVGWLMWNDETYQDITKKPLNHEKDSTGNYYAHSKGLIGFDKSTGFWIGHSAPGFPYGHNITPNAWAFNTHQAVYAQHFFCTTFSYTSSRLGEISSFLKSYYLFAYDSNVPSSLTTPASFNSLINGAYSAGTTHLTSFKSKGGVSFVGYGKNGKTDSDLWEDYVAPGIKTGLNVESWCGGDFSDSFGCQPSDCAGAKIRNPSKPQKSKSTYAYDSVCITNLDFGSGNSFETKYNHAKLGIARTGSYVCIGDINRQTTQRKRGGGAICFKHAQFYGVMNSAINGLNVTCSN